MAKEKYNVNLKGNTLNEISKSEEFDLKLIQDGTNVLLHKDTAQLMYVTKYTKGNGYTHIIEVPQRGSKQILNTLEGKFGINLNQNGRNKNDKYQ